MRQIWSPKIMSSTKNMIYIEDELQCSICTEMFIKAITLSCSHTFCKFCIKQWQRNQSMCPICRTKITVESPTIVLDNFIDKMVQNATAEMKRHREAIIVEREKIESEQNNNTSLTEQPTNVNDDYSVEISSDESDTDVDSYTESVDDDYDDVWVEEYNGLPGCYYGGYGNCYACGGVGHWANGCPIKRRRR